MKRRETAASRDESLHRAREHHAQRSWVEASEAFAAADAVETLQVEDLELFAVAVMMCGDVSNGLRGLERVYEARLARGEESAAARAAFWSGMRLFSVGEPARASGWLARAQRLTEGKDCVERGYLVLLTVRKLELAGDVSAAEAAAGEAQAIGDRFREADLSAFARSIHGAFLVRQGRVEAGLSLIDEAMIAVTSGKLSATVTGLTYCTAIAGCQQVFALQRGREWTAALSAWCQAQPPQAAFMGKCLVHRSEIMQLGGDWAEAIGEARRAADAVAISDPQAVGDAFYQQGEIHRLRGAMLEAESAYRAASEHGRDPHPGLALLWLRAGRGEAAAGALRRVLGAMEQPLRRAQFLPATVEIMLAIGASEEATSAARELEEIAARFGTDVLTAMAAHARGAVELAAGRAPGAVEPLRRAFALWQQLGAPYLAARVRLLVARACQMLGDDETAKLERELACAVLERLGAAPDAAGRVAPDERPATGAPFGLSARELQVLRLVATGKTNKAIAKELFLSEKTIDRHVSNIFTKLNVATRAAATAFAYEHHLV